MYENDNPMPYEGMVKMPNEIKSVRDPLIFGLTGRELIFVVIALALAGGSAVLLYAVIGVKNTYFLLIPALLAAPPLAFGLFHPAGLMLEDWLTIWWSNNVNSAQVRKQSALNGYERVQQAAMEHNGAASDAGAKKGKKKKEKGQKKQEKKESKAERRAQKAAMKQSKKLYKVKF